MKTRMLAPQGLRRTPAAVLLLLAALAPSGCILGNDTDGPVLAVDLLWDLSPTDRFAPGTCKDAKVLFVAWRLKDHGGEVLQESDKDETCAESGDGFNFYGLYSGNYVLEVEGVDDQDAERWRGTCKLELDRFDTLYRCKVLQEDAAAAEDGDGNAAEGSNS